MSVSLAREKYTPVAFPLLPIPFFIKPIKYIRTSEMSHTVAISDKMVQTWAEKPMNSLFPPLPPCQTKHLYLGGEGEREGGRKEKRRARISLQKIQQHKGNTAHESIITHLIMQKHSQVIMYHANSQHEAKGLLSTTVEEECHQYSFQYKWLYKIARLEFWLWGWPQIFLFMYE